MLRTFYLIFIVLCSHLVSAFLQAGNHNDGQPKKTFYQDSKRGFFWHEKKEKQEKEQELNLSQEVSQEKSKTHHIPFSVEHIREQMPILRDAAINNPTDDRAMLKYYVMSRAMNDKGTDFADATRLLFLKYPQLSETKLMPIQAAALLMRKRDSENYVEKLISNIGKHANIFYFYRANCAYCQKYGPLLSVLSKTTQIGVLPISLDGMAPTGDLPKFRNIQELPENIIKKLNIRSTPTTYLVTNDGSEFILLADEFVSLSELKERIIILAHDRKWITKEEFNKSKKAKRETFVEDIYGLSGVKGEITPEEALDELIESRFFDAEETRRNK